MSERTTALISDFFPDETHAMTVRFPARVYEQLRDKAHGDRASINKLVNQGARLLLNLPDQVIEFILNGGEVAVPPF